ncbi:MAG: transcription termination/antitermination protein NusA, partial [Patulibacter sp.]|nr:transcription termination/antitermination protein NusA [Patulibacter sp.]
SIIVSRRDPEMIRQLFALEVPEIADGLVEITDVAREPGYRAKIAVVSHADGVDPVGACVGPRGSRVRMVVSELRGEKIDIIPFNEEPARFVAKALSPARVREVYIDDENRQATVIVPDDQLALAIGREGQNARLAARLTGWRIDIRSETDFVNQEDEDGGDEGHEEHTGMCAAILGNGRRCPNDSLPGLRYCGLTAHQALSRVTTDLVAALAPLSIEEVEALADPTVENDAVADAIAQVEAEAEELEEQFAAAEAEAEAAEVDEAIAEDAEAEDDESDADEAQSDFDADDEDAAEELLEDVAVDEEEEAELAASASEPDTDEE